MSRVFYRVATLLLITLALAAAALCTGCGYDQDSLEQRIDNGPAPQEWVSTPEELRAQIENYIDEGFLDDPDMFGPDGVGAGTRIASIWAYLTEKEQEEAYANAGPGTRSLMDRAREEMGGESWEE